MGLLDVLNGMQNGPRGPSNPGAQTGGGMSPMTMAILALLAYKAVKHLGGSQPNAAPAPAPSRGSTVNAPLPGGGMGGGGLAGGGLGDLLKGGFGLIGSDERLKTDIQPMGKDDDTGVPVAAYRYKGDPKSYPKVVGPMAADVEKKQPGSTVEVGGYKAIKPAAAARFGIGRSA